MTFDKMFYLQVQGTTMSAIFSPTYGELSMGFREIELYTIIRSKFTLPICNCFEQNWKGFLDYCFIFLRLILIKPEKNARCLNSINPAIQCTMKTSDTQLPYLHITINKEDKKFFKDIYSQPTFAKRCVSFHSNHPRHCLS